jgi:serine/threonine-protein kinase
VSTSLDPWLGSELAGYRLEELLGRGGMGVVYRAWDPRLKRQVAVKLIAPELSGDPAFRERFLAEAELAAALEHPNVVPIHDAGEVEGQLYLVMRLVEGSDLKTLLAAEGPLPPRRAVAICAQLAGALDAAHARGLVHRDVKPSNVLLGQNEHVYLADFGLTRELAEQGALAVDGRSVGTPAYVAPEQITGGDTAAAADQYALGCVLFECLTGEPPFTGERELAVLFAHLENEPPLASGCNAELPEAVDPVLRRALAKDPGERYPSCGELVADARSALGLLPAERSSRRRGLALMAIGALVLAAGLAIALGLLLGGGSEASRTLVTNSVTRLDPESGEVSSVAPAGTTPTAVAAASGSVWAVNQADGTVSQVDAETGELRRTFRVNGLLPSESYSTIAADGPVAWVVSTSGGKGLLTRLGDTEGPFPPQIPLGITDPIAVAVGEGSVWVAGKDVGENLILEVDPRGMAVVDRVPVSRGDTIQDVAVGEGSVWFTDYGAEETLWRLDPESLRVTGRLDTAGDDSIAVGAGGVWLGDIETGTLARVDPATMRVVTRLELFEPPFLASVDVAAGGDAAWLSFAQGRAVYRVDARTNRLTATLELAVPGTEQEVYPPGPRGITVTEDGVWVAISSVGE